MSILPETLHPLTLASFVLDYRLEGDPLQVVAKRFSCPENFQKKSSDPYEEVTLVMTAGIGCNLELWLPTIKHIFELQSRSNGQVRVQHIWAVEWPNHGDAAILNETILQERYSTVMTQKDIGIALRHLVRSGLIDTKTSKLVSLSHSAGVGSNLIADEEIGSIPFDAYILLEPPLFNRNALPFHKQFCARSIEFSKARLDVWPTLEDAMNWHKVRAPWKMWHPEVLQVFAETNFRSLPTVYHPQTEGVTTKTYKGQDAASFNTIEELYACVDRLSEICVSVPVHVIFGSRKDFWPRQLGGIVEEMTRAYESKFASIATLPGAGHYVAQDNPHGLAAAVLQALRGPQSAVKL